MRSTVCNNSSVRRKSPRVREHRGHGTRPLDGHMQDENSMPYGYCHCRCGQKTNLAKQNDPEHGHVLGEPFKFLKGHSARLQFAGRQYRIEDRGYVTPCWIWQFYTNPNGYGILMRDGESLAHRVYYKRAKGSIPRGYEVDHLCRQTECVNPDHLEAVTPRVNALRSRSPAAVNARKTHCIRGHELAGDNLIIKKAGGRNCRTCQRASSAAWYARRKQAKHDA